MSILRQQTQGGEQHIVGNMRVQNKEHNIFIKTFLFQNVQLFIQIALKKLQRPSDGPASVYSRPNEFTSFASILRAG